MAAGGASRWAMAALALIMAARGADAGWVCIENTVFPGISSSYFYQPTGTIDCRERAENNGALGFSTTQDTGTPSCWMIWGTANGEDVGRRMTSNFCFQDNLVDGGWLASFGGRVRTDIPDLYGAFTVQVKMPDGRTWLIAISADDTIDHLKARIQSKADIPPDQQRIVYAGKQLEDGRTLGNYNIWTDATVHLILRLRG